MNHSVCSYKVGLNNFGFSFEDELIIHSAFHVQNYTFHVVCGGIAYDGRGAHSMGHYMVLQDT